MDFLKGKKTFIITILAVLSVIIGFVTGQVDLATAVTGVLVAAGVGSLRADMIPSLSFLTKYRTYFLMAGGIIAAIVGYMNGGLSLIEMIMAIMSACGFGTFSAGIRKSLLQV